jgi:PAS domain S-box-containing protein
MLESLGVRSLVSVAIVHDDRLLGVVALVWVRSTAGTTTAATFPALRILGNSLLAALDRARAEEALRRRRDAEALVAEIARELVAAAPVEVDAAITRGLERTGRFVDAQAASLVTVDRDRGTSTRTHLWDDDEERAGHWVQKRDAQTDGWIRDRFADGDVVLAHVPDDLADIAPVLRERLVSYGVQTIAYLALRSGGRLLGWVTLVWFHGDPGTGATITLPALRVLGEVYLLALERARVTENLRKSARSLEWAQATAHIGSWSFEPDTGDVTWSDELYRILGFEPGSVPATPETFHTIVPAPDGGGITAIDELRAVERSARGLRRATRPDGEERIVVTDLEVERDTDGRALHVLGTVQDVTEAVRAEQAVRDSEARFRALVLESGELIQLVDVDGTILYASPAVERDLGWDVTGARVTDQRLVDVIHPDDRESLLVEFVAALDRPHEPVQVAYRVRDRDGSWRSREAMLTNMLDDPRVNAVVLNARDVTERRELEEQLRESQKMEAVGQLAGGIAHDFNNLLTAITGYTALLMDDVPEDSSMRSDLEQIQRAADRAAALVEKLLQFSRRQPTKPVLLDVNEVIESLRSLFERVIGEHIQLETALSPYAGLVRADRSHVEQVVINFVVNARDAMPSGGTITIESTDVVLDPTDAERLALGPGRYLRLDVTDTGTGMDESVTAHIFEPFFTTKSVGKGTGLGLSTVYGIVTGAGGHVSVSSRAGEGSTFTVHLPVERSRDAVPIPPPAAGVPRLTPAAGHP